MHTVLWQLPLAVRADREAACRRASATAERPEWSVASTMSSGLEHGASDAVKLRWRLENHHVVKHIDDRAVYARKWLAFKFSGYIAG